MITISSRAGDILLLKDEALPPSVQLAEAPAVCTGVDTLWSYFSHQSPVAWQAGSELHCLGLTDMVTHVPMAGRDVQQSPCSKEGSVPSSCQCWCDLSALMLSSEISVLLFSHHTPSP